MSDDAGVRRDGGALAFFRQHFDLDDRALATALDAALERRVDYADLFFEYATQDSVVLEEGIVKSGDRHIEQGVGVRAQTGERQGYAHSDEVTVESVALAAATARAISQQESDTRAVAVSGSGIPARDLYPVAQPPTDVAVARKVSLLEEIDVYARSLDPRIVQVMASVVSQHRHVLVAGSDGTLSADVQPLVRLKQVFKIQDPHCSPTIRRIVF